MLDEIQKKLINLIELKEGAIEYIREGNAIHLGITEDGIRTLITIEMDDE